MSGIRRRSSKQSDVPPEEWPSQRQKRATSPNYELPHDEAMEMIDRLVQGEETNSEDGAIVEKIPTLQSMAIQPVVSTRLPRPHTINFEELSLLTRDEVFPHLKFDHLKTEGILLIDGSMFARGAAGPQGQLPINVSREGLKEYLVFPGSEDSSHVVTASVIEAEFLRRTGHKSLKDAWTTLKEDLHKAQNVLAYAAQREEALRAEHERLQEEYSQEKAAWENKNKKLEEEAQQLHEEQKRIMGSRGITARALAAGYGDRLPPADRAGYSALHTAAWKPGNWSGASHGDTPKELWTLPPSPSPPPRC
ncbi:hypothetical protein R1flu_004448 [Riccia fluitans]|uniref:Uncharacterized protein n=1 Tax=Riccia fluitans TaxID=41844 RepID=A0ABD1YRB0_9MARC